MDAELTDEGEVKISGDPVTYEEKQAQQQKMFEQQQAQKQPETGDTGIKKESNFPTEKGKAWYVKEVIEEDEHKHDWKRSNIRVWRL